MAISALEQNVVSRGLALAHKIITEIKPEIDRLNIDYDSQGGVGSTITTDKLNEVASFGGLTKQQLDDGMYAMTAVLRQVLQNGVIDPQLEIGGGSFSALEQLAVRR